MRADVHVGLYRKLIRAYPRDFRDGYGEDLVAVFALQLEELGALRCWIRTMGDLALTVVSQHLERPMTQRSTTQIAIGCVAVAVGATAAAVVTGTSLYGLLLLLVAAAASAVAVLARRAAKPAPALERSANWKRLLIAGTGLLAVMIVLMNLPGPKNQELSELGWTVMMISLLTSFTLIAAGIVLGATRLLNQRSH